MPWTKHSLWDLGWNERDHKMFFHLEWFGNKHGHQTIRRWCLLALTSSSDSEEELLEESELDEEEEDEECLTKTQWKQGSLDLRVFACSKDHLKEQDGSVREHFKKEDTLNHGGQKLRPQQAETASWVWTFGFKVQVTIRVRACIM